MYVKNLGSLVEKKCFDWHGNLGLLKNDLAEYLAEFKDGPPERTVLISVKKDAYRGMTDAANDALGSLGLKPITSEDEFGSYYAVISEEGNVNEKGSGSLGTQGKARRADYAVVSSGWSAQNFSSVVINGEEYSLNEDGINIVVYDSEKNVIEDSVCFDTSQEGALALR